MIFEFPVLNEEDHRLPLFIEELGYLKNQDPIVRDRTYTNTQILICTAGSGRLMIDGAEYIISANNVFMTRSHVPHEYHALSEPWTIRWIVFDGNYLDTLFAMLKFGSYEIFHLPSTKPIADIFKEALAMLQSDNPKKHLEFSILIYTMITQLSYYMGTNPLSKKTTKKQQTYGKLLTYIHEHYDSDISLDLLGNAFDLSPYYISRLFKEYAQMGLITYLNQYRISMAKKLLLQKPGVSIKSISRETGFTNSSYFCAQFKKSENISPLTFRKFHGLI